MLLRLGNMRGLDLNVFDFDYDLSWTALLMNADGQVYGRFGSHDLDSKATTNTLRGLRFALEKSLEAHRFRASKSASRKNPVHAEDYPAAKKLSPQGCIHCHHVNEFRREEAIARKTWKRDDVWVYPLPENLGITLDPDQGNRVRAVGQKSSAERAGMKPGDVLEALGNLSAASQADVQYALNQATVESKLPVRWQRVDFRFEGTLALPKSWRETDLSWRWSLRSLKPEPCVHGDDLTRQEKAALGLDPNQLAFRQGNFLHLAARQAGLQLNDIVLGVKGKPLSMTARQFAMYLRLNYQPGDVVELRVLRGKERLTLAIKLPS